MGFTAAQQQIADLIIREFQAAGWKYPVAAAAVVNAYAESGLNPNEIGDSGRSVGLFQLHESGGGRGMTTAQRQDPTLNTRRIIEEANASWSFRAVALTSDDIPTLAGAFSTYVERPRDKAGEEARRKAMAEQLFPAKMGTVTVTGIYPRSPAPDSRSTFWWYALAGVAIVSVALTLYMRRKEPAHGHEESQPA